MRNTVSSNLFEIQLWLYVVTVSQFVVEKNCLESAGMTIAFIREMRLQM